MNIYAPNMAPQYIRQILTSVKEEINSNTIIVGECNTQVTPVDRSSRPKMNKETQALKHTFDWLDLMDIYFAFHPKTTDFTFFSSAHGTFFRIDRSWGTNQAFVNFKKKWNHFKSILFRSQCWKIKYQLQDANLKHTEIYEG